MLCFLWTIYGHTEENTKYYKRYEKKEKKKKNTTQTQTQTQNNLKTDRLLVM